MQTIVLVIHVMIAIALVSVVLIQKSEGGGLGMGGGGMSGLMTGRSTANLLTRVTGGLFAAFVLTSITLSVLAAHRHSANSSALDRLAQPARTVTPAPAPTAPAVPKAPSVPIAP